MIRFDHVTFGYEAERPVLRELSLEIRRAAGCA